MRKVPVLSGCVVAFLLMFQPLHAQTASSEVILAYAEVQVDDAVETTTLRIEEEHRYTGIVLFLSGQTEERTKGVFFILTDTGAFGLEVLPQVVECDGTIRNQRGFTVYPGFDQKLVRQITFDTDLSCRPGPRSSPGRPGVVTLVLRRTSDLISTTH